VGNIQESSLLIDVAEGLSPLFSQSFPHVSSGNPTIRSIIDARLKHSGMTIWKPEGFRYCWLFDKKGAFS